MIKSFLKKVIKDSILYCENSHPKIFVKASKILTNICHLFHIEEVSYSLNCEDIVIRHLCNKKNGFFVDVGAHHPIRFSNTYQLSLKGWQGINIDPLPGCMGKFQKYRLHDINLEIGIDEKKSKLDYFSFTEPAYNTINKERAEFIIKNEISPFLGKKSIYIDTLKNIFDEHLHGKKIDLLNIDVESKELDVLKSNDWNIYRPYIIVMESLISKDNNFKINLIEQDPAVKYLINNDYAVVAKVCNALFFMDIQSRNE